MGESVDKRRGVKMTRDCLERLRGLKNPQNPSTKPSIL